MANMRFDVVQRWLVDSLVGEIFRVSYMLLKVRTTLMLILNLLTPEHFVVHGVSIAN